MKPPNIWPKSAEKNSFEVLCNFTINPNTSTKNTNTSASIIALARVSMTRYITDITNPELASPMVFSMPF